MKPITAYIKNKNRLDQAIADGNNLAGWTEESEVLDDKIGEVDTRLTTSLAEIPNQTYITEKAKQTDLVALQTQVQSVASGSPKGVFSTLSTLQTAFPTGNSNIYITADNGHWNYWNGLGSWVSGGQWQSIGIAARSVTPTETSFLTVLMTNLFNKTDVTTGKALNYTTGALYTNANYSTTGFIEIKAETTYKFSHSTENRVYYDANKTMIPGSGEFSPVTSITTPVNAKYIRFMVLNDRLNIFMFVEGSTLPSEYYPFGKNLVTYNNVQFADDVFNFFPTLPSQHSKLFGKKWNVLGDSITYGAYTTKSYHQYIAEKTGCVVTNYGISSSTVSTVNGGANNPMVTRYSAMSNDADIITVFGGVNDAGYGTLVMGDINSTDPSTFYGAYNVLLDGLIKKYPTKLIATFTPMKADDGYRPKLIEIAAAVREVSAKYGVPCLDLYNMSGISLIDEQQALLQPDKLHPNAEGHRIIAGKILSFLEGLMPIDVA